MDYKNFSIPPSQMEFDSDLFWSSLELHDGSSFPFSIFDISANSGNPINSNRDFRLLHWHQDLQFTLFPKGEMHALVNGQAFRFSAGDGLFINSNMLHVLNKVSPDGHYITINFTPGLIAGIPGGQLESEYVHRFIMNNNLPAIDLRPDIPWKCELLDMLSDLVDFCKTRECYAKNYEIMIRIQQIWLYFIRHTYGYVRNVKKTRLQNQHAMQQMLDYIHDHFHRKISLQDIADAAHISTAECSRLFQFILHYSPYDYLLYYRIVKAGELLIQTDQSVTEIAGNVGFNDTSNFIRRFRKITGQTPLVFRKSRSANQQDSIPLPDRLF